jgi:hypothetical protein
MSSDVVPDVSALAINVPIPEELRWTDTRRGEEFVLSTLNVRLLPDGHLAASAEQTLAPLCTLLRACMTANALTTAQESLRLSSR